MGSSPRVWGQGFNRPYAYRIARIIPTRVGTSICSANVIRKLQDHPHACGDKSTLTISLADMLGSSPRVWGQASRAGYKGCVVGIIPTRVGTRQGHLHPDRLSEDHPHACGDKTKEIKENSGFAKSTA